MKNVEDENADTDLDEPESPTTPNSTSDMPKATLPRERSTSAPNVSFNAVNAISGTTFEVGYYYYYYYLFDLNKYKHIKKHSKS